MSAGLSAQTQSADEAKAEKEFYESVQKEIDRLSRLLDLDDAQVFYVDSILVHDYKAMQAEVKDLSDRKVSNVNMYYDVQDKWQESIYEAYHKVFDEDQWAKYLKNGAARDKKARDKRRAKAQR
ncbi:MAG: hypothetical protein IKX29_00835 [Bacteroidales bacterium]|nr:hypothetical protein [Bacteroidales bacterium]